MSKFYDLTAPPDETPHQRQIREDRAKFDSRKAPIVTGIMDAMSKHGSCHHDLQIRLDYGVVSFNITHFVGGVSKGDASEWVDVWACPELASVPYQMGFAAAVRALEDLKRRGL